MAAKAEAVRAWSELKLSLAGAGSHPVRAHLDDNRAGGCRLKLQTYRGGSTGDLALRDQGRRRPAKVPLCGRSHREAPFSGRFFCRVS